jgi:hypothetical protein
VIFYQSFQLVGSKPSFQKTAQPPPDSKEVGVCRLVRFLPDTIFRDFQTQAKPRCIAAAGKTLKLPMKVERAGLQENVAELNGLAIPAIWEAMGRRGKSSDFKSEVESEVCHQISFDDH